VSFVYPANPAVAGYVRVSTTDQTVDRQLTAIFEYASRNLDVEQSELEVFRDKSTGTDVARDGYQELMDRVDAGAVDIVVVHEVSRVARSISDLSRTADRLRDAGVQLHVVSEGLTLKPGDDDPYQAALFQLLGVFAELEAKIKRKNVAEGIAARQETEDYHHGPAPFGFAKENGRLIEGPEFHRIVAVLDNVASGEQSKRQAAKKLDCTRHTIKRAVEERADLYGL
jgi:Site-specific recombinases, DNA invertase Pin homologs